MNVTDATPGLPLGIWAVSWGSICHWSGYLVEINNLTVEAVAVNGDGGTFEIRFRDSGRLYAVGGEMDLYRIVEASGHGPGWNPLAVIVEEMDALPSDLDHRTRVMERGRIALEGLQKLTPGTERAI